jgi:hypothetical protein
MPSYTILWLSTKNLAIYRFQGQPNVVAGSHPNRDTTSRFFRLWSPFLYQLSDEQPHRTIEVHQTWLHIGPRKGNPYKYRPTTPDVDKFFYAKINHLMFLDEYSSGFSIKP